MPTTLAPTGYFRNGLAFNRFGDGLRPLIVFQGLLFENKPQSGPFLLEYKFLHNDYTVYSVLRKPGLPQGYTLQNMADDYAEMIREEFGGPVDVIGISTGGSILQHFAADHPELVRRLVIHSSAHTLSDSAKQLQLEVAHLAQQRRWAPALTVMLSVFFPRSGPLKMLSRPLLWLMAGLLSFSAPQNPSDLVITIEAEDKHNFKNRLAEIAAPTLVMAGTEDPFYTESLFRETAAGIPNARLILYEKMGHPASGKQFEQDLLAFLKEA